VIITFEPGDIDIIITLRHIYDYRLEPGDIIIIIALTHAAIYDYRLALVNIDIIIALTQPQFMIIASNLVISILLSP
jgi:hypothetical protein